MLAIILSLFIGCGEKVTYTCTEAEVLQECDGNGENQRTFKIVRLKG